MDTVVKLLFVNGSRGEWGYIRPIIDLCVEQGITYEICATNMVLLNSYGSLIDEIREEGYNVGDEILMSLEGGNRYSMAKSLGIFVSSFVDILHRVKPTWVILAGDRGEQLAAAIAAAYTYTPTAHIQAGERSGNIDGVARHAIGKFAHVHFAANEDAARRLLALGEQSFRIFNVGAPQLDDVYSSEIPSRIDLFEELGIQLAEKFILVVNHPVTEDYGSSDLNTEVLIDSLSMSDMPRIWILPNNDAGGDSVRQTLVNKRSSRDFIFSNLRRIFYLSLLKYCAVLVGNSSSGLLEAPSFATPAVNLGRRQVNRVRGHNVIDAEYTIESIVNAIELALDPSFKATLRDKGNPYGDGQSSKRIIAALQNTTIDDNLLVKELTY